MNMGVGRELQYHHSLSTSQSWDMTFQFISGNDKRRVFWWIKTCDVDHVILIYIYIYNKRKNFTISCIQIGFNASKDIQEWMATVNLNLLILKTNISSILFSFTQVWQNCEKQTNNHRQQTNVNQKNKKKKEIEIRNKIKNKKVAASPLVS